MHPSLARAAHAVAVLDHGVRRVVAIDGVDGAGKSTFADRLVPLVDRPAVRASIDDFHHARAIRYRRGRESPEGFYLDSYDLGKLTSWLLDPFAAGDAFRRRAFDHVADTPVDAKLEEAPSDAILVLDGLFLHRRELLSRWDLSIWLDVPPQIAALRLLRRDGQPTRRRYSRGNELYAADAKPTVRASLVLAW
ncbi:MAG: uridine kinase [Solirubrobacteraceae bacterium]|jgi:uridine kinase|nr:uridine kinase [Solirubrobacteraceae bacterium]